MLWQGRAAQQQPDMPETLTPTRWRWRDPPRAVTVAVAVALAALMLPRQRSCHQTLPWPLQGARSPMAAQMLPGQMRHQPESPPIL